MNYHTKIIATCLLLLLAGCGFVIGQKHASTLSHAELSQPKTKVYRDLISLPPPKGKISVAVYGFRDMTGQYKSSPDSNISTVVTQGAASMLIQALNESNWFIVVEREGLQDLLTERKVHRALAKGKTGGVRLTPLIPANIVFEGGIIAYDTNYLTGGMGAKYLGIGGSEQYRLDQVTIILRAVNVRDGRILDTVQTNKTILSQKINFNLFKFIAFKSLLQTEIGYSYNEPVQLCAQEAIQSAVVHLIARGIHKNLWYLAKNELINNKIIQEYSSSQQTSLNTKKNNTKKHNKPIKSTEKNTPFQPPPPKDKHLLKSIKTSSYIAPKLKPNITKKNLSNHEHQNKSVQAKIHKPTVKQFNIKTHQTIHPPQLWAVNLASVSKKNLKSELEWLKKLKIPVESHKVEIKGKVLYRIRVTGFSSKEKAERYRKIYKKIMGANDLWINREK